MIRRLRLPAVALVLAVSPAASAYDVATSKSGAPLHWAPGSVAFALALDPGPAEIDAATARTVAVAAAATWQAALADSGVTVAIADGAVAAAPHAADGVSTVRWLVDAHDPDLEPGLLGRTFVAYTATTGELKDADVVLDAADFTWTSSLGGCGDEYDLQSALTHEFGHGVGLAHAIGHPEATMFATGDACESTKRDLAPDDVAGLMELYVTPAADGGGGCAAGGSLGGSSGPCLLVGAAIAAAGRRRRRRPVAAVAVVGMAMVATSVDAAQLRRLAVDELAARAVVVVRGHVVATAVVRDPGLETDSTVVVDECLAGPCPARLAVRRHGGELDDDGLAVGGEAELAAGDEVVLFVRVDGHQHARVLGGVQGLWRVDDDGLVVRDLRGHDLATSTGWRAGEREVVSLDALRLVLRPRAR